MLASRRGMWTARRLADALVVRGVYQRGGGVAWEYPFPFGGGRAGWTSGMAQAVAAQALARTAELVPDDTALSRAANAAYHAIPKHLLTSVSAGPWIKLYSFGSLVVLNAQLQAVVSLQAYADVTEDAEAAALAERMRKATAATIARFDSGYWTYYALPGDWSPLDYQQYVVQLLKRLGPTDPRFAAAATRFSAYAKQPPASEVTNGPLGSLRFWLSKPAAVTATTAAGPVKRLSLSGGWHTVAWPEPKRAGFYAIRPECRRLGRQPGGIRHTSDRSRCGDGPVGDRHPRERGSACSGSTAAGRRRRHRRSGAGFCCPRRGPPSRPIRRHVARGRDGAGSGLVAALQRVTARLGIVIDLYAAPVDDAGRAALAQYGASLVQQVPSIRDVLLAPAPAAAAAAAYALAVTALRSALLATGSPASLGVFVDGALTPKATLAAVGQALAGVGGTVDVVGFKPAPAAGKNLWTLTNVPQLTAATAQAFPNGPSVLLDGVVATPTAAADLISRAACSTTMQGIVLEQLTADAHLTAAATAAQRGTVVCPGLQAGVDATTLTFPESLAPPAPAQVLLRCSRDCLYLVTLVRADGTPVVAKRGQLRGGAAAATVALPRTTLRPGTYSIDVRLVAQVNPGAVTRLTSPELPLG